MAIDVTKLRPATRRKYKEIQKFYATQSAIMEPNMTYRGRPVRKYPDAKIFAAIKKKFHIETEGRIWLILKADL